MSGVLTQQTIGVDLALIAAKAALEESRRRGYPRFAVAVTNRAGHLLVLLKSDDGGAHLVDSARRKAYTAASMNARTSKASKAIDERAGEPDPHLVYLNDVLIVGGGVPIHAKGELIGAIGVAGSPGSVRDEECADAGIAAIATDLA
ncbi:heme-binding protein [Microbacteriaceae bacterium K1510]|nr:heme-binding protein [Microbacteriaceae bacterium K1510]